MKIVSMKKRNFLAVLGGGLLALFAYASVPRRPRLKFFWVYEDTEVFVAASLEVLNKEYDLGHDELLTLENRGDAWDYVDGNQLIEDEGKVLSLRQFVDQLWERDWFQKSQTTQLLTSYN